MAATSEVRPTEDEFLTLLAKSIASGNLSFNVVTNQDFSFFYKQATGYEAPSPYKVEKRVCELSKEVRRRTARLLRSDNVGGALVDDAWTSKAMDGYMGAGFFYINGNFELRLVALGVESMPKTDGRRHDGERMASDLDAMLNRFDKLLASEQSLPPIRDVIHYVTSDEAKAMLRANRLLLLDKK